MKKIVLSEKISEKAINLLKENGFNVVISPSTSADILSKELHDAYGVIMRSTKLTADMIAHADNLKIIARHGTGVDNIDIDAATKKGILVAKVDGANAYSVAEYVITCILALSRRIFKSDSLLKSGTLCVEGASLPGLAVKYDLNGHEIRGKKLGIIGLGKIGKIVAKLADALGMEVVAYDPFVTSSSITLVDNLNEIYKTCDVISINLPLTESTKNMIAINELKMMKKSMYIINSGRGGIINEDDLATALNTGIIAGAALDVFFNEPPKKDNPLLSAKNVILTSHIAGITFEAGEALALGAAQAIIDLNNNKLPEFPANAEVWENRKS